MASSEEFKQAIREGRLNDAFVLAISKAPDLEITTWIASADSSETQPQARKFLRTHINLVEGEITNKIGSEIIGDNLYQKAQQFHIQQVSQGHQTITHNLESLQQILRLMTVLQKQKQGESYQPLETFKISASPVPEANVFPKVETNANYINPVTVIAEETPVEDNMLSLGDLEAEADKIPDEANLENGDNDWGDWLEDDQDSNLGLDTELLTLEAFDIDESEEWEDETEFLADSDINRNPKDDNKSEK